VQDGKLTLRLVAVVGRTEADRRLGNILSRVKYIGPQPEPTENEVIGVAVDAVRAVLPSMPRAALGNPSPLPHFRYRSCCDTM
jgi:hypothetical protein